MSDFTDYKVADMSLADWGRKGSAAVRWPRSVSGSRCGRLWEYRPGGAISLTTF